MKDRSFRITVPTKDIEKSVTLYRDVFGLKMRPICNAIAMFPLGQTEFQVCLTEVSEEMVGFRFAANSSENLLITIEMPSQDRIEQAVEAATVLGVQIVNKVDDTTSRTLRDFNGVNWILSMSVENLKEI